MKIVRTNAPASLPVTRDAVKVHLNVDFADDDSLIDGYISAAVAYFDGWSGILGRCLVTQTWQVQVPDFGSCGFVRLPFPDVQTALVTYIDQNGVTQTFAAANYHLTDDAIGSLLFLAEGASFPSVALRPDAVTISIQCGYGDPDHVPPSLKHAMMMLIAHWYASREAVQARASMSVPFGVEALAAPHRRVFAR
ncbi:MAG: head-tail connector protein [Pseudomonadota bacterium]